MYLNTVYEYFIVYCVGGSKCCDFVVLCACLHSLPQLVPSQAWWKWIMTINKINQIYVNLSLTEFFLFFYLKNTFEFIDVWTNMFPGELQRSRVNTSLGSAPNLIVCLSRGTKHGQHSVRKGMVLIRKYTGSWEIWARQKLVMQNLTTIENVSLVILRILSNSGKKIMNKPLLIHQINTQLIK